MTDDDQEIITTALRKFLSEEQIIDVIMKVNSLIAKGQ